jgi:guanosine-3',5'-bis(diphosphate) 3'-pyrophosphohydrolase
MRAAPEKAPLRGAKGVPRAERNYQTEVAARNHGAKKGYAMTTADYRRVLEAASLAARAHEGQLRKDHVTPYVSHPFRVCLVVRDRFGFDDPRLLITALLHDVIEDTTTDFDDIEEQYGHEIATWVSYLSKDKRLPDHERELAYIKGLQEAPWQVQVCKLADVFDNLMDATHLSADRQARSVKRAEQYLAGLRHGAAPEMKKPIALVEQALKELHGAAVEH